MRDRNTNMCIGVAYVMFKTKAAAHAALQLNGTALNNRPLRISRINKQPAAGRGGAHPPTGRGRMGEQDSRQRSGGSGRGFARRGPSAAAGGVGMGVRQGGVQKRPGRPMSAAGDWQGLQTKGKGAKIRGPKAAASFGAGGRVGAGGGGRAGGGPPPHRAGGAAGKGKGKAGSKGSAKSKRPAVAARKAQQRAKAAAAKKK